MDENPLLRAEVLHVLGYSRERGFQFVDWALDGLSDENAAVRYRAVQALRRLAKAGLRSNEAAVALPKTLADPELREEAERALVALGVDN